jgi:hypothetical protein
VCVSFALGVWQVVSIIIWPQHLHTYVDEIIHCAFPLYEVGVIQIFSLVC